MATATADLLAGMGSFYLRVPPDLFIRAADALHLACAAVNGFTEVYSHDRHQRLIGFFLILAGRRGSVAATEVGKTRGGLMGCDGKNARNEDDSRESRLIPPRGDYHLLLSFQKAEVIYDLTFQFARRFLARGDRTVDQMIQAARSGKKNLLEGSKAGRTSKETELKLTNVARASLEELLDDYRDFLRVRGHLEWAKDSQEALYVRRLGRKVPQKYDLYRSFVETRPPEISANIALCLIHQANYLIDQQLLRLERDFLEQGGLRERMTRLRLARRARPCP